MDEYNSEVVTFDGAFSSNVANFGGNCSSGGSGSPDGLPQVVDYDNQVINRPKINGVTLTGDKTTEELGLDHPIKTISQNGVTKVVDENRNVNIEAPEVEMSYTDMLDIWKQWFS